MVFLKQLGMGSRASDFISDTGMVYILKTWWGTVGNQAGHEYIFATFPSSGVIEMPVLFFNTTGNNRPLAFSNNIVNSLVDGNTIFVADIQGPIVNGINVFNDYVDKVLRKIGFTNIYTCDEIFYHLRHGSIHCGTNAMRTIPAFDSGLEWWNLFE